MLESIHIQNYKSVEDAWATLGPLTVLIGPNNSGKSNVLDCLAFLGDLFRHGSSAVESRGGFPNLIWRGDTKRTLGVAVYGKWRGDGAKTWMHYTYEVELSGGPLSWRITRENFDVEQDGKGITLIGTNPDSTARYHTEFGEAFLNVGLQDRPSLAAAIHYEDARLPPVLKAFGQELIKWDRFEIVPSSMRKSTPIRRDLLLSHYGENLATVLHELYTRHRDVFADIEDTLKVMVPEVNSLTVGTGQPGETYIELREDRTPIPIPAWSVADGILKLLAVLCLAHSPGSPSVVCLEEPENFLHPYALRLMVDAMRSASDQRQFILSTHSPVLLDCIDLKELRTVEKKAGSTEVRKVVGSRQKVEALKALGIGEAWYAGHLGAVP
jgi:predicted ATPase